MLKTYPPFLYGTSMYTIQQRIDLKVRGWDLYVPSCNTSIGRVLQIVGRDLNPIVIERFLPHPNYTHPETTTQVSCWL